LLLLLLLRPPREPTAAAALLFPLLSFIPKSLLDAAPFVDFFILIIVVVGTVVVPVEARILAEAAEAEAADEEAEESMTFVCDGDDDWRLG
jgi:hypothetical protein